MGKGKVPGHWPAAAAMAHPRATANLTDVRLEMQGSLTDLGRSHGAGMAGQLASGVVSVRNAFGGPLVTLHRHTSPRFRPFRSIWSSRGRQCTPTQMFVR